MKILGLFGFLILSGCTSGPDRAPASLPIKPAPQESLTSCLQAKGVKMYGAEWCGACAQQKAMFQRIGETLSPANIYVECATPEGCKDISAYPTWSINGRNFIGIQSLISLRYRTGC